MKRIVFGAAAILAVLATSPVQAAELSGLWSTQSSGGVVEIAPCGELVCGVLVQSPFLKLDPSLRDSRNEDPTLRARPLNGLIILSGFKGGPTSWAGGQIYNPDDGRTYSGSLELVSADSLKVTGCAARRRCRTQVWRRVTR